jgi:hypothetical protein
VRPFLQVFLGDQHWISRAGGHQESNPAPKLHGLQLDWLMLHPPQENLSLAADHFHHKELGAARRQLRAAFVCDHVQLIAVFDQESPFKLRVGVPIGRMGAI